MCFICRNHIKGMKIQFAPPTYFLGWMFVPPDLDASLLSTLNSCDIRLACLLVAKVTVVHSKFYRLHKM